MTITMMVRMAMMPKRVLPRQFSPNPLVLKGLLVLGKTKPLVVMPVGKQAAVPVPALQKVLPKPKASTIDAKKSSSESEFVQSMEDPVKDMDRCKASCKGGKKATKTKLIRRTRERARSE